MRLALSQARRASGRSHPNPPVGAVVLRGERVLGRGATQAVGGAHAEIVALEAARRVHGAAALRGATLAVTLEPCAHHGRTPPCVEAILAAGLARVWVGQRDPHPRVAGRGLRRLRQAGLRVETGVLEEACRQQHRGFLSLVERGRPFVALKLASSLDGRIATASGESRWISGEGSRAAVQRLRARADAIWVGRRTVEADDPELLVRLPGHRVREPIALVADTHLRLSLEHRLFRRESGRCWLLCGESAPAARQRAFTERGLRVLALPECAGRIDPAAALTRLAHEGISEILVEGGGELAASLLRADRVDEVHWFVAPLLLGGDAQPALGALGSDVLAHALRLETIELRRLGYDLWLRGVPLRPRLRSGRGKRR